MKKLNLLIGILIGIMILSSCSSDDDSNSNSVSIVGIWKPIKEVFVCSTGNEETSDFSTCLLMTRLTFNSNNTFNNQEYSEDTVDCLENFSNGTWTLITNNLTFNLSEVTVIPTFFELTDNIIKIGYYNNDNLLTCDNGSELSYSYVEYVRIE
ncbi:lipocalin family protein [Flavobacteriaceae bacterium]|nr:lipocalin family protein [Flavobacteriaceae bacterium]